MKNKYISPEWQARQDWREEGVFRPGQLSGMEAKCYRREAKRILREWSALGNEGLRHVGTH